MADDRRGGRGQPGRRTGRGTSRTKPGSAAPHSRRSASGRRSAAAAPHPGRRATPRPDPLTATPLAHAVASNDLRATELAAQAGVTVQLLRSYQSKGLLPPPRRDGRLAWYGRHHLERLRHIRELKERGYSLRMIAEALTAGSGVAEAPSPGDDRELMRLRDVAERAQVPPELLRSMEASGLLRPFHLGGEWLYTEADVRFVRQVLVLLGVGLSLDEFIQIAHPYTEADVGLAETTIDAWNRLVAAPIRNGRDTASRKGERVVTSAQALASIVGQLVGYHVERVVFQAAQRLITDTGTPAERRALMRLVGAQSH